MSVINNEESLLIRCSCHYHVLEISSDSWTDVPTDFCITVWNQTPTPITFRDRLRLIWKLVQGKNLNGDDVVITKEDAHDIVDFLSKKLKK